MHGKRTEKDPKPPSNCIPMATPRTTGFVRSEAHKNYVPAKEVDKGILRTAGSKLTFGYFCSVTKVTPAGGETA